MQPHPWDAEWSSILLCAADRDLRLAVGGLMAKAGHRALLAADTAEAMSLAISLSPRCIIVYLPLPGGEPAEVLRSLRSLTGPRATPIFLISPSDLLRPEPQEFRPGFDCHLPPTVAPEQLLAAVERAAAF